MPSAASPRNSGREPAEPDRTDSDRPRGKRELTKERNRSELLAAARKVFAELGYDAATVRDVVRRTDLSVGTFYQYFRDKDEIFTAVAEEVEASVRARLQEVREDPDPSPEERLYRAYLALFTFVVEERRLFEVLERHLPRVDPGQPNDALRLTLDELEEDLVSERARDLLGDANPKFTAAAVIGSGLLVARAMLAEAEPDPEAAARFCTRFSMAGLAEIAGGSRES
ncbi:MAG: TetR/AcrR family transcriptional regulator [Proteobacteria bacterium]|nr:TetR/AcrR family transcriptional regulator [Pseudomonadota bacterium]